MECTLKPPQRFKASGYCLTPTVIMASEAAILTEWRNAHCTQMPINCAQQADLGAHDAGTVHNMHRECAH